MQPEWARDLIPTAYTDVFVDENTGLFVTVEPRTDRINPNFTIWTAPSGGNLLVSAGLLSVGPVFHYYQDKARGIDEHIRLQCAMNVATHLMEAIIREETA